MSRFTFPEWTQTFRKWLGIMALGAPVYLIVLWAYGLDAKTIRVGYKPEQPVPYSHALHVGKLGLDCRYCHNTVERSSHAAVPPAETCMNCHTNIKSKSAELLPIREAFAENKPVEWVRVHDLPDYVFFNHSAHVRRGVGCESCHGRIDRMKVVTQVKPLTMSWCLDCHRNPNGRVRPLDEVTTMGYEPAAGSEQLIPKVNPSVDCSTCHR